MLTHIVLFKFKSEISDAGEQVKAKLLTLPPQIPEIKTYDIGKNSIKSERNYDLALYSQFDNTDGLQTYQQHPKHLEVLDFITTVIESVAVVDYETE